MGVPCCAISILTDACDPARLKKTSIQEIIADDPSIIGLGDLVLKDKERIQPKAGRLDLLLQDPDTNRRYEVEIQLGKTDESHIIRTIEYWDIEKKRYPQYDHCAVIIAEDITSRFLNVISLFNGFIPLIAIQMNVYKFGDEIGLVFTKVLDEMPLGLVEEDEEINIDEIIKSLREEDEEQELPEEEETEEVPAEELEEAYNVIRFLKGKINEVNLLNAKLLYSNKLFRNFSLNEGQKMKVIENFDRAFTLREVKLVYSTLAEGFKMPSTRKVVKESFASKPIASTKPARQIISEGTELANRFKKLAGLK